jgi:hypothetical protein
VIGCSVNRFVPVLSAIDHDSVFSPLVPRSSIRRTQEGQEEGLEEEGQGGGGCLSEGLMKILDAKFGATFR